MFFIYSRPCYYFLVVEVVDVEVGVVVRNYVGVGVDGGDAIGDGGGTVDVVGSATDALGYGCLDEWFEVVFLSSCYRPTR